MERESILVEAIVVEDKLQTGKLPAEGLEGSPAKSTFMKFHDHHSFHHWKHAWVNSYNQNTKQQLYVYGDTKDKYMRIP
ncbi:hypothetical protein Fmac_032445 [Flemingia macrophylla]|uniref:Uncharacterized protein n=1 Tax=Flemingia macrophylla TaxID=520843 RepID=A0ABD1L4Z3_9FABA